MDRFLPYYPRLDPDSTTPREFLSVISSKKEFASDQLGDARLFPHQKFVERYMGSYTPYDDLILFHEMGSGKTQSAVATAEALMSNPDSGIVKTVVVVRGKGLGQNFVHELVFHSTGGKYETGTKAPWKKHYEFWTMEVFGKSLAKLSDRDLIHRFDRRLFIIDEAHHLKKGPLGPYAQVHRLLHLLPRRKVLLLTGTPMKDDAAELANCANLILPMDAQLPYGADFTARFFRDDALTHRRELRRALAGRVSFYRGGRPNVEKVVEGEIVPPMQHLSVVPCAMHPFQERAVAAAHRADLREGAVYINARQASLFVFPDGSYGRAGFTRYIDVVRKKSMLGKVSVRYRMDPELDRAVRDDLARHSSKYARLIDTILAPDAPKTFVYLEFVHGGGAILLGEILKTRGYIQATGSETKPGKRFILATNQTLTGNIVKVIERFNAPDNDDGSIIQIFIGSQIVSEGYSLKNVAKEMILTPHWNFSEIEQIIARCWRIGSHTGVGRKLSVSLLATELAAPLGPSEFERYGIDLYMYRTSEIKDFRIKQVERLLKEVAVDCHLMRTGEGAGEEEGAAGNSSSPTPVDGSRECDYGPCETRCLCRPVETDQASYDMLYPPYEPVERAVTRLFRASPLVRPGAVVAAAGVSPVVTMGVLADALVGNIPATTARGGDYRFLRRSGGVFYLTADPTAPVDLLMPEEPVVDASVSPAALLADLERAWLEKSVRLLFDGASERKILSKLPQSYQHMLLTACLYAAHSGKDLPVIDRVLAYYRGFYRRDGEAVYVWLFHEKFGTLELKVDDDTASWRPAARDIYQEIRDKIHRSPVGYYGLYNPHLDEFCLRKSTAVVETDLRRVNVGRRCDDWDQTSLVEILNQRLGLGVDITQYNRAALCGIIRKEMFRRGLVLYNFDCGNQFKIRGRI